MKKIVGIIAAAALAASAFAEINIGSWSRGTFVPVAYDGDDVRASQGTNWDGSNSGSYDVRTGLGFSASSENAGVVFDVFGNPSAAGATLAVGDNAYVWVKPVEMLRVAFGKVDNNWGRVNACFGEYDHTWRYAGIFNGEGLGGTGRQGGTGANITLTPVEGLVIDYNANFWEGGNDLTYKVLWQYSSTMIGYTIPDTAFIRLIVNGNPDGYNKDGDKVANVKFGLGADIWAVENLALHIGASLPTNLTGLDAWEGAPSIGFGVAADYTLDPVVLHGFVDAKIQPKEWDDGVKLGEFGATFGVGVDFAINDMFTVIADFRYKMGKYDFSSFDTNGDATFGDDAFGAYLGLAQKLSNAVFDFGVQLNKSSGVSYTDDSVTFAIPLMITTSF